jgi:hypothetical protein
MHGLPEGPPKTRQTNPAGSLLIRRLRSSCRETGTRRTVPPGCTHAMASWGWKNHAVLLDVERTPTEESSLGDHPHVRLER